MNICTVTTRRRVPYARVLAESFHEHHPDGLFSALVCDLREGELDQGLQQSGYLTPADLGLAASDISRMAMAWPETLLKRALIPDLLKFLCDKSSEPAFFFSDDTFFSGPINGVGSLTDETGLVLALRTSTPLPADGRTPDRSDLLEAGVFQSSFAGVAPAAKDCLEFWRDAVWADSLAVEPGAVAERIQDLVAAHFPPSVLHGAGFSVSFFNVWHHEINSGPAGLTVQGSPLSFFHFEGFRPDEPHLLSRTQGPRPRVLLSERADLRSLARNYSDRLMAAGFEGAWKHPYGFAALPSGVKVDMRMRRLYRRQMAAALKGDGAALPDPFDPASSSDFVVWLNSPDEDGPAPKVSRYLYALYEERGDLRAAFPGIARADAAAYLDWVIEYGAREADIPEQLRPPAQPESEDPAPGPQTERLESAGAGPSSDDEPATHMDPEATTVLETSALQRIPFGLNIVGYFKAELGVGEMGRLILAALGRSQVPYATSAYAAPLSRQTHPYSPVGEEFSFDTNLFCVNADQLVSVVRDYGTSVLEGRFNIGLWWWEVDVLPPDMAEASDLLDEIWVGSEYVGRAVVKATDKVVRLLPVPIRPIDASPLERSAVGMPEDYMFLCSFDFLSVFERKNPIAVVQAFKQAFSPGEGPCLLIKTINGQDHLHDLEKLRLAACGRPDISIFDGYLSPEEKDRLVASSDCYVSLHRAEGYGLGMAEAMALGKPIIATRYSGNLAYLNDSNSYLIGHTLVPIPAGAGPYPAGATWADPDIGRAAAAMREVYLRPEEARQIGRKAREDALTIHTFERTAAFVAERLDAVRLERSRRRLQEPPATPPPGQNEG